MRDKQGGDPGPLSVGHRNSSTTAAFTAATMRLPASDPVVIRDV